MPRVSVIIPAFNAELYVAEALMSVVAQTYRDWETIVADDGSTDRTVEMAAGFGDRVKVVRGGANAGPGAARNLAIAQSTAELLAFLDSDDYWLPRFLEEQVALFDATEADGVKVGIVGCDALVLADGGVLRRTYLERLGYRGDINVVRLLGGNPIFTSTVVPGAVVDEVGGFTPGILAEDHDLWLRIVERGYRVITNPRALAVYRVRRGSASADPGAMARAAQTVVRRALERGSLTPRERRAARRELRRLGAIERIASGRGPLATRYLRVLPLLVCVVLENPKRWLGFARNVVRGRRAFDRFLG
jgi:glycosyltransferase involved in cell wall biosynthesis